MAHFAELDDNNVVVRVIVVGNEETHDKDGVESEELGVAFCRRLFGLNTKWKQTSYNGNIRYRYAGIGCIYREDLDAFILPQPYPSWTLNKVTTEWEPPIPEPVLTSEELEARKHYTWDETNQAWNLESFFPDNSV